MNKWEILALAVSNFNGGLDDPTSKAFKNCNPGLLRTYRPELKCDSDHYRVFTTIVGGFKALIAHMQAKCDGKNHHLRPDNTLKDLLGIYGFKTDASVRPVILFLRKALEDDSLTASMPITWLSEPLQNVEKAKTVNG